MTNATFAGRIAVVTGGASGIGLAIVQRLLARGATVYVLDTRAELLTPTDTLIPITVDVSDISALTSAVRPIPRIDFLVNAAGIIRTRPIEDITESDWDALFNVNARGVFFLTQMCAPKLVDQSASVVNISSIGAVSAVNTDAADYHATKTAVLSITRSWARALAPRGIRVNAILPGLTSTPLLAEALGGSAHDPDTAAEARLSTQAATVPLGRIATPDEIAGATLFLLGADASYVTGTSINVSGGVVMV